MTSTTTATKVATLTPLNVRALREVYADAIESGALVLTSTTATWPGSTPDEVARLLEHTISRLPGRGHPRQSLHAVLRKVNRQATHEARDRAIDQVGAELEQNTALTGGYRAVVFPVDPDSLTRPVNELEAPFGEWAAIGLWLDECGYNDSGYRVEITFEEPGEGRRSS